MEEYVVLVFPCGTEIANEIFSSLIHNKYFKLISATSERNISMFDSNDIYILPYVNDEVFLMKINELIVQKKIDFVIPAHDDVALILSRLESSICAKVIGQTNKINEIVRDKKKTYNFLRGLIPIPEEYTNGKELPFPVFVKPRIGQGSKDAKIIKTSEQYQMFFSGKDIDDFLVLEYLSGDEYTIDCFSANGNLMYSGARTRDKTINGISVRSTLVNDAKTNEKITVYANKISESFQMNGLWFFQLKRNKQGVLHLLEVASRVSGTMMVNRVRGVNFVELALYQKLGAQVEVILNQFSVGVSKKFKTIYEHDIKYQNLYIDFDDTLCIDSEKVNTDVVKLIFEARNHKKNVFLITKNKTNELSEFLRDFGLYGVFKKIIHLNDDQNKVDYMEKNSLLIDDSFSERKKAIENGVLALGLDAIEMLIN